MNRLIKIFIFWLFILMPNLASATTLGAGSFLPYIVLIVLALLGVWFFVSVKILKLLVREKPATWRSVIIFPVAGLLSFVIFSVIYGFFLVIRSLFFN